MKKHKKVKCENCGNIVVPAKITAWVDKWYLSKKDKKEFDKRHCFINTAFDSSPYGITVKWGLCPICLSTVSTPVIKKGKNKNG